MKTLLFTLPLLLCVGHASLEAQDIDFARIRQGPGVSVLKFGAFGDDTHDDTVAIQAAIDSVRGTISGGQYYCNNAILLPGGTYKITAQLKLYAADGAYNGCHLTGASGPQGTRIDWQGPSNQSAIRSIGKNIKVENLSIEASQAWASGYSYDGDPAIGISTAGELDNVFINCNSFGGDGIRAGANAYQADQWKLNKVFISYCTSGKGISILDANALAINAYNISIIHCWIGVKNITSSNFAMFGGEIDENDVNFLPGNGATFLVSGTRTEGSKRQVWTATSGSTTPFTYTSNTVSSWTSTRSAANAAGTATTTAVTFSAASFTFGDYIDIAGAGAAGGVLHTRIINMTTPLAATIGDTIATTVAAGAVTLTAGTQQDQFVEQTAGPWVHTGNTFNNCCASASQISTFTPIPNTFAYASQIFIGNSWGGNISSPFGTATAPTRGVVNMGNYYDSNAEFSGPFRMLGVLPAINTGTTSNTDLAGTLTLSAGSATYTFANTFTTAPVCIATDSTAAAAVKASASTTVLTITGTGTDVINYHCFGKN